MKSLTAYMAMQVRKTYNEEHIRISSLHPRSSGGILVAGKVLCIYDSDYRIELERPCCFAFELTDLKGESGRECGARALYDYPGRREILYRGTKGIISEPIVEWKRRYL